MNARESMIRDICKLFDFCESDFEHDLTGDICDRLTAEQLKELQQYVANGHDIGL